MHPKKASHFARRGIACRSRQARNIGPKETCRSSHDSSRMEDLAKHPAARMRNGVVGKTGKNTPRKPRVINPNPKDRYIHRNERNPPNITSSVKEN